MLDLADYTRDFMINGTGGDNGTMHFWDWKTGYNFQRFQSQVQPGSLDSEAGLFAMCFDHRFVVN